uniref:recombinase family protein n=1 Tax=Leptolyngbya sp. BC1307 TaxID=2029589 RepID=UPI001F0A5683
LWRSHFLIAIDLPQLTDFSMLLEFANSVLYIGVIKGLKKRGVQFASIQDGFDTSPAAGGKMVFSVIGAMAEYERNLIRARVIAQLPPKEYCKKGERS